jgi:hypothetical protein
MLWWFNATIMEDRMDIIEVMVVATMGMAMAITLMEAGLGLRSLGHLAE